LPPDASHFFNPPNSKIVLATTPSPLSRLLKVFSRKCRKILVISGAGPLQMEGIRDWCEGFGEVSQIRHMPNGDLQVYFKKEEVADTVCRVQARVVINDVGSVSLSWFQDKK